LEEIMKHARFKFITAILVLLVAGVAEPLWAQLQPEAGFITLEENTCYFHLGSYFNRVALRSSPARLWYVFQPADEDPESKPIFVFFNGGPGGATSCGLLAANTGRNAVFRDETTGEAAIIPNPSSWTRIGNLLHIDSRTAGFSYSLMDNPGDELRRQREFDAQNYESFTDGADFVRFLLRFLAAHPSIRGNRVVLVPESYGGTRTIVMLHFLLYYESYANGRSIYQNPGLVEEIRTHYDTVYPGYAGRTVPPAVIAGQFGHEILIQTSMSWYYQRLVQAEMLEAPGSLLDQLAAETGVPYIRYRDLPGAVPNPTPTQVLNYIYEYLDQIGRDPYICSKPSEFFNGHRAAAAGFLTQLETLNLMIGVNAAEIGELYATARTRAYKTKAAGSPGAASPATLSKVSLQDSRRLTGKVASSARSPVRRKALPSRNVRRASTPLDLSALIGPPPAPKDVLAALGPAGEDDLAAVFGNLQPWDRFFIDLNYEIANAFALNRITLREYDVYFRSSLLYGRMFLENAAWVETFLTQAAYDTVIYAPAVPDALGMHAEILSGSVHDTAGPPGAVRPGQIVLTYRPSSVPGSSVTTRTIRFPGYALSGHAVTLTQPAEMLDDVIAWLASTGIPARGR
jgi:hypothetical protein